MEDLREGDFLDHSQVYLIESALKLCLDDDFLFAAALDFGGEDGPPRRHIHSDLCLNGVPGTSDQCDHSFAVFSGYVGGGFERIDVDLEGVLEVDLVEVGREVQLLAAVQVGAAVAGGKVAQCAGGH